MPCGCDGCGQDQSIGSCLVCHHLLALFSGLLPEMGQQGGTFVFAEESLGQQDLVEGSTYKSDAARSPALIIKFAGTVS